MWRSRYGRVLNSRPVSKEPVVMRVELVRLLAERPIVHPTRIERAVVCRSRMELTVSGHAWWSDTGAGSPSSRVALVFEELSGGELPVCLNDPSDEDLEAFWVQPLAGVGWAQPDTNAIYCNGPLPDPAAVYSKLQAYLAAADAFKAPGDFLNQGEVPARFAKIASGRSYLLARGPDAVCRLLCDELDRQAVSHTVIAHIRPPEDRLWVRLNGSGFLCKRAWAEFDG